MKIHAVLKNGREFTAYDGTYEFGEGVVRITGSHAQTVFLVADLEFLTAEEVRWPAEQR